MHNTVDSGHGSQYWTNGLLSSTSWECPGHFSAVHCWCRKDIQSLCVTLSQHTMISSVKWMAVCNHWICRRQDGRMTYFFRWRLCGRSCQHLIWILLIWLICFPFQPISLNLSGSYNGLASGKMETMLILRTRPLIQPHTRRDFCSMWRRNTAPKCNHCPSLPMAAHRGTIPSLPQWCNFQHVAGAAFELLEWSPVPPALSKNILWAARNQVWMSAELRKSSAILLKLMRLLLLKAFWAMTVCLSRMWTWMIPMTVKATGQRTMDCG